MLLLSSDTTKPVFDKKKMNVLWMVYYETIGRFDWYFPYAHFNALDWTNSIDVHYAAFHIPVIHVF